MIIWPFELLYMQSLDFSATIHLVHLLLCVCYGGFPLSWAWWITMAISLVVMTVVGEWLCWRTELQAIPLSDTASRGSRWQSTPWQPTRPNISLQPVHSQTHHPNRAYYYSAPTSVYKCMQLSWCMTSFVFSQVIHATNHPLPSVYVCELIVYWTGNIVCNG